MIIFKTSAKPQILEFLHPLQTFRFEVFLHIIYRTSKIGVININKKVLKHLQNIFFFFFNRVCAHRTPSNFGVFAYYMQNLQNWGL